MAAPTQALRRTRLAVAAGFFLQGLVFAASVSQVPTLTDKMWLGDGDAAVASPLPRPISAFGVGTCVTIGAKTRPCRKTPAATASRVRLSACVGAAMSR